MKNESLGIAYLKAFPFRLYIITSTIVNHNINLEFFSFKIDIGLGDFQTSDIFKAARLL